MMAGFLDRLLFDSNRMSDYAAEPPPQPDSIWRPKFRTQARAAVRDRMRIPAPNIGDQEVTQMATGRMRNISGNAADIPGVEIGPWQLFQARPAAEHGPWEMFGAPDIQRNAPPASIRQMTPGETIDEGAWQNPVMERIRQLTLGAAHAVAHPIETAGNVVSGMTEAAQLPGQVYSGEANLNDPETLNRAISLGLMISPAVPGGVSAAKAVTTPAVTAENIGALKSAAYKEADALGAAYSPEAYKTLADKIAADAEAKNISAEVHSAASSVIRNLQKDAATRLLPPSPSGALEEIPFEFPAAKTSQPSGPAPASLVTRFDTVQGTPITLTQLDQKRQMVARDVAASGVPGEKFFGKQIIKNIDEFIANSGPEQMAAGAGPEAAGAIQTARDLNTRFMKSKSIDMAVAKGERRAASTGSGGNTDNAIRQNLRAVFEKGNWTPSERVLFEQAIRGTRGQNLLRAAGKFSPTTGGLVALLEVAMGVAGGGLPLGALAVGGAAAKFAADRATKANVAKLTNTILAGNGGPVSTRFGKFPRTRAGARALAAAMISAQTQQVDYGAQFQ